MAAGAHGSTPAGAELAATGSSLDADKAGLSPVGSCSTVSLTLVHGTRDCLHQLMVFLRVECEVGPGPGEKDGGLHPLK